MPATSSSPVRLSRRGPAAAGLAASIALALAASQLATGGAAAATRSAEARPKPAAPAAECPAPSSKELGDANPKVPRGPASPLTDPDKISDLAADAYEWGLPAEFVYRFGKYNYLATAKRNTLGGGSQAAAWNNNATNAGDASVLYLNAMLDVSGAKSRGGTKELVMTVPPSAEDYYVVDLLDSFINTTGSIGTRTTPSPKAQTYLIVGPTSKYADRRTVRIKGFRYRVMPTDTNLNWMLIRIRADSLTSPDSNASTTYVRDNVMEKFALQSLRSFERAKHKPDYFKAGAYTAGPGKVKLAKKLWHNTPAEATEFFMQMGRSLRISPLPDKDTGLNGTPLKALPPWIAAQPGAKKVYRNPSFGQQRTLARFRLMGLTENGFRIPSNWGQSQIDALQDGFEKGHTLVTNASKSLGVSAATNYWQYANSGVGSYPNTPNGYEIRAIIVLLGGSANLPEDAVYPSLNQYVDAAGNISALDGNLNYTLTFEQPTPNAQVPVHDTLPPMTPDPDDPANPAGFWSIHVYAPDDCQAAAPFISQASVLNTAYSTANLKVIGVDPTNDTVTVEPSRWAPVFDSYAVVFGATAATYGLTPGTPYYAYNVQTKTGPGGRALSYTFNVATTWQQSYDAAEENPVPIQGQTQDGTPVGQVQLANPSATVDLTWGPVQPVSQLGSQQLTSGKLYTDPTDGSVTIYIGPTPPANPALRPNWIPTASTAYYQQVYGATVGATMSTLIRPMIRMYYPAAGSNNQPSILPPPNTKSSGLKATWVIPQLAKP